MCNEASGSFGSDSGGGKGCDGHPDTFYAGQITSVVDVRRLLERMQLETNALRMLCLLFVRDRAS